MAIILLILTLLCSNYVYAEVEIYSGGKKYATFEQYKNPNRSVKTKQDLKSSEIASKILRTSITKSFEKVQQDIKALNSKGIVEKLYKEDLAFVVKDAVMKDKRPLLFIRNANKIKILRLDF